jgi:hypothetical protein
MMVLVLMDSMTMVGEIERRGGEEECEWRGSTDSV